MPGYGSEVMVVTACLCVPGMQECQACDQVGVEELNHQEMTRNNRKSGHRHEYPLVVETKPEQGVEVGVSTRADVIYYQLLASVWCHTYRKYILRGANTHTHTHYTVGTAVCVCIHTIWGTPGRLFLRARRRLGARVAFL